MELQGDSKLCMKIVTPRSVSSTGRYSTVVQVFTSSQGGANGCGRKM